MENKPCTFETFDQAIYPDDRAATHKIARDAVITRLPFRHEYRVVWPDGSIHWIEGRGHASYGPDDKPRHMMGTVVDITQRKAAEEAARAREAEMAHLSRVSIVGQMASGLAHELNQPLGAIINYAAASLTQLDVGNGSIEDLRFALRETMNETRRAAKIITKIREFVHKQQPEFKPVDLNALVRRTIEIMQFEFSRFRFEPRVSLAARLPPVLAESIQIEQVLVNLLYNAMQAMDENWKGPRQIAVETSVEDGAEKAAVSVTDTGPGIDPANLARIYDPFFTTKPKGLGIGLNISRSIIESHGGRLSATSNPQGGMRFTFTIPFESRVPSCPKKASL